MENIPCNKKEKNILSREKRNTFRKKSLDCGLVRMGSLKSLPVARIFVSKRTAYRNKPHAFCRTIFITAHKFVASLLTRYSSKQHSFRLSNLNLMDRIPTDIFNNNGQLDYGLSDAAFVTRRDTDQMTTLFRFSTRFGETYCLSHQGDNWFKWKLTRINSTENLRWEGGVEEDVARLGCRNWKVVALNREGWRKLLKEAEAHPGL